MARIKRLGSFLLALAIAAALAVPVFADDVQTGTVTVENATNGTSYKIYRIFQPGESSQYEAAESWKSYAKFENGKAYYKSETGSNSSEWVEITQESAAKSLNALVDLVIQRETAADGTVTASGDTAVFTHLPYGYYLLIPEDGVGGIFPLEEANKVIHQKNATEPTLEKKIVLADGTPADWSTVNLGDDVQFKVSVKLPSAKEWADGTGYEWHYPCSIEDEATDGLQMNRDVAVKIDGDEAVKAGEASGKISEQAGDIIRVVYNNDTHFAVRFGLGHPDGGSQDGAGDGTLAFLKLHPNAVLTLTYSAKVIQKAAQDPKEHNTITLHYGSKRIDDTVYVYDFTIVAKKVDKESQAPLPGAKFVLQRASDHKFYSADQKEDKSNHAGDHVTWIDAAIDYGAGTLAPAPGNKLLPWTVMTSEEHNERGMIHFEGIGVGTYLLHEIQAPEGYSKIKDPVKIVIREKEGGDTDPSNVTFEFSVDDGPFQDMGVNRVLWQGGWGQLSMNPDDPPITVENSKGGFELPETGGLGTALFYLLGGALSGYAVFLLIFKNQRTT